ncbi:UDP-galactose/UDP-glucose transporter 3 isoform X2 [Physcomitrium patens]|uniref:UDP-galactose/UDP-glucose transporter 3 isoform X2 n=1 Tax=Physcomitrium patens TaxID=3218 RepID=UPI00016218B1|nr:UDP-galactose/UDP-glucose transporter 3-like isoform X2 [Physcomitrium patens]|eukprot:XP_024389642.1 UDP-galactose/UDP-glucose transporter 3-like isoform X2 [Physcomitrella patens]
MPPRERRPPRDNGWEDESSSSSSGNSTSSDAAAPRANEASKVALFSFCVAAIYGAYITQGVLQEKISTTRYGKDQQRFDYLTFLNLTQCLVCFVWSFIMLKIWPGDPGSEAPILEYCWCSVSNAIGPACGMLALKFISFPAQVLAKSSKMIPVMLMGALVYGVRYSIQEYLCTFLVAGGVAVFAIKESSGKPGKIASPNAPLGYTLCLLNLALDGFTNATQDALSAKYPKVTAWHLMMGMNLWGALYMCLFMFLVPGGGGYAAVSFCLSHSEAARDIFLFCLCGAVGQNFIFLTISHFGALTNTTITTTRKFVSILVSSLWNGNVLSAQQWTGVAMVFLGLSYQIWCKHQKNTARLTPVTNDYTGEMNSAARSRSATKRGKN